MEVLGVQVISFREFMNEGKIEHSLSVSISDEQDQMMSIDEAYDTVMVILISFYLMYEY